MPRTAVIVLLLVSGCKTGQLFQTGLNSPPDAASYAEVGQPPAGDAAPVQVSSATNGAQANVAEGASAALERGHQAFEQSRLAEAKAEYLKVLQIQPQHGEAHHRLAVIADNENDFPTAEQHYLRAIEAEPNDPDLLSDLGYSYLLQGRYDDSRQYLQQALELNPSHPQATNNFGLLLAKQGHYEESLAMFRRTGTEADAQRKIAQLFPGGRPEKSAAQQLAEFEGLEPEGGTAAQLVDHEVQPEDGFAAAQWAAQESTQAVAPKTREVMDLMRQAREEGVAARNARQPAGSVWDQQSWTQPPEQAAAYDVNPGQVPDHRLNDVLARIDRAPADSLEPYPGLEQMGQHGSAAALGAPASPSHQAASPIVINPSRTSERVAANPQDALDVWPPETSTAALAQNGATAASPFAPAGSTGDPWANSAQGVSPARHDVPAAASAMNHQPVQQADWGTPAAAADPWDGYADATVTGQQQFPNGAPQQAGTSDPIQQARLVGMNAGPGQMFPVRVSTAGALPAASLAPGTGARMGGTDYPAPHEFSNQAYDSANHASRGAAQPDAYEQMIQRQNNELNGVQRSMYAERGLAQPAPQQLTNPADPYPGQAWNQQGASSQYDSAAHDQMPPGTMPGAPAAGSGQPQQYAAPPTQRATGLGNGQPGPMPDYYRGNTYDQTTDSPAGAQTALDAPSHLYGTAGNAGGQPISQAGYPQSAPVENYPQSYHRGYPPAVPTQQPARY